MLVRISKTAVLTVLLVFFLTPYIAHADHCSVSKISIVPGSWDNSETQVSLIVQAQDAGGESCHVRETLRLSFGSTGLGTFTSQTGNPVQAWISSNSANRNFYYQHPSGEEYTITVTAGYGPSDSWTVLFTATYDSTVGTAVDEEDSDEEIATTTEKTTPSTATVSSHYSASPVTTLKPKSKLSVGAGRARLAVAGSPVEFKAESSVDVGRTSFTWSFGDGTRSTGETVVHAYEYPGEYVVVLNVSSPDGTAVSRTDVRVVPALLSVVFASPEKVEISNSAKNEVNLYGRALYSGGNTFLFPQDTIIKAGQKISFSSGVTGLVPRSMVDVALLVVGTQTRVEELVADLEEKRAEEIALIREEIGALQGEITRLTLVPAQAPAAVSVQVEAHPQAPEEVAQPASVLSALPVEELDEKERAGWLDVVKQFFLRR